MLQLRQDLSTWGQNDGYLGIDERLFLDRLMFKNHDFPTTNEPPAVFCA